MNKSHLFIANASGILNSHLQAIQSAYSRAAILGSEKLGLDSMDVICIADAKMVIPETGVGGFTPGRHLIYLYIDPDQTPSEDEIFYTLCHEMHHAKRYEGPGYGKTLLDSVVFEGLATCFEAEVSDDKAFLVNHLSERDDVAELTQRVQEHLDDTDFNYYEWFINDPSGNLPRWTGYLVGYRLVKSYLAATNKKASEAVLEDVESIRKFIGDAPETDKT